MSDKIKHLKAGDKIWAAKGISDYTSEEPWAWWTITFIAKNDQYRYLIYMTDSVNDIKNIVDGEWEICMEELELNDE